MASVLAALFNSALAQTAGDRAKDVPRFKAASADACASDVSTANSELATAKEARTTWIGGGLATAEKKVVDDRKLRDDAVKEVVIKDLAFKEALELSETQYEKAMALYVTAMTAKKAQTDAEAE